MLKGHLVIIAFARSSSWPLPAGLPSARGTLTSSSRQRNENDRELMKKREGGRTRQMKRERAREAVLRRLMGVGSQF